MAAIDTKLDLSRVSGVGDIKSFKEAPSVSVSRSQTQKGSKFESLAKALSDISPTLLQWSDKYSKEKATEGTLKGANAINGMTLNEARIAHKAGFPDIENAWARYGAYKQYASNAADNFVFEFQNSYNENKHDKKYNWETDLAEKTQVFLEGKEEDVYFQGAYSVANTTLTSWINKQEVEKQSALLTERVKTDTSFQVKSIPKKVETRIEVDFLENYTSPHDFDDEGYYEAQAKFRNDNFIKYWEEELDLIKTNLNPAITLSDLDSIIISQGEAHVATDGRYAAMYKKMITEERPDGTPAIMDNPKYQTRAEALLDEIARIENTGNFYNDFQNGNVSKYSKKDFIKNSDDMLKHLIKVNKAQFNIDDNQAFAKAVLDLMPAMKKNAPIKYIQEILNRPIGREVTRDNRLGLQLAILLHKEGLFGAYFDENNKQSVFWSIAVNKFLTGNQNPDQILKELGQFQGNFMKKAYSTLISENKEEFNNRFGRLDMLKPKNRSIIYPMGEYFKNVAGDGWENELESWVKKNYTEFNEVLYSKNKLQELGIEANEYENAKKVVLELLNDKLSLTDNLRDSDLENVFDDIGVTGYKEIGSVILKGLPKEKLYLLLEDYELILNPEDGEISLGIKHGDVSFQLPATWESKDGTVSWLTVPISEFRTALNKKAVEQKEKLKEKAFKKDKKISKINKMLRENKSYYLD